MADSWINVPKKNNIQIKDENSQRLNRKTKPKHSCGAELVLLDLT